MTTAAASRSIVPVRGHAAHRPVIAQVLHRLSPAGAEVLAAALARELSTDYRFVFVCLDAIDSLGHELADEGFEVISLDRQPGVDRRVIRKLRGLTRDMKVDLIHAHQYTPFFYAAASRGLASSPRILFTEHGRHYPDRRSVKRVIANKLLLRRGDHVTAVGDFIRQALITNEGMPARRIDVIHNGIEPERFGLAHDAAAFARAAIRQKLGLGARQPVVLQVARFHSVKDHGTAVRAFAQVLRQHPTAMLLFAGDGTERDRIESLAREMNVDQCIRFLGLRHDIPQLMAASDVFMLSSLSEGLSVTLLEAMGAGLPIVATAVGGNPEVVEDGVTGLLAPRGDDSALSRHLCRLIADGSLRRRMGDAGRQRLTARFTQANMHDAFSRLYGSLILDGSRSMADGLSDGRPA